MSKRFSDCKDCGGQNVNLVLKEKPEGGFYYAAHCLNCGFNFEISISYAEENYNESRSNFKND